MAASLIQSFHRHLHACGMAASTQERYVASVARLIAFAGVPAEAITSQHAYDHLIDQSNRLGLSASWYNIQFVAIGDDRGVEVGRQRRGSSGWMEALRVIWA